MMYGRKSRFPCESYWGNLCGGFGGSLTCHGCGWDRYEHIYREQMLAEFTEQESPKYGFEEFKANHPEYTFEIKYNDYYDWWEITRDDGMKFEVLKPSEPIENIYQTYIEYFKNKETNE